MSTTDIIYTVLPTKKEILQRLLEAGHIDFNEMWVLLEETPEIRHYPMPSPSDFPNPYPWQPPFTYTTNPTGTNG